MTKEKVKSLLVLSAPPHIKAGDSINKIMWTVAAVLMIPAAYSIYIFGFHAALILITCAVSGVSAEAAFQYFMKREIKIRNGSSVITGLLVGMNVPPNAPIWMAAIGTVFAVIIVKELFGGLGSNIFNPTLAGRAFMTASWPVHMTTNRYGVIGDSFLSIENIYGFKSLLAENLGGCIGEASVLLIFIGGLFLIFRRIITWHIPVSFIGSIAVASYIYYYFLGFTQPEFAVMLHIFTGGVFLGAFFMATDMVTSPVSGIGMIIFGIGCGLLAFTIRAFGGYPEGVSYSILIMNAAVPLIDRFTRPAVFGVSKER
ncbi:MAG: RnfABCDGE type electron transport complex subunit D [Leptospirales bacterium]|nr:RnfABCDGE type electron transport complex subunit D [Leptospirales bacterium]